MSGDRVRVEELQHDLRSSARTTAWQEAYGKFLADLRSPHGVYSIMDAFDDEAAKDFVREIERSQNLSATLDEWRRKAAEKLADDN